MTEDKSAETAPKKIRLNKFIARSGYTSRRKADELISAGEVTVNGEVKNLLGIEINPEKDEVIVKGYKIDKIPDRIYIAMNKPKGYICANSSPHGDRLIKELLPKERLNTVGRLDKNTTGLLLLTNDGELSNKLAHPSNKCEKEYMVKVKREIPKDVIARLKKGVEIKVEKIQNGEKLTEAHFAKPLRVELIKNHTHRGVLLITLGEGKKRQVRLMMEAVGFPQIDLKRIRIGGLTLGNLESGKYRHLSEEEVNSLLNQD